MQRRIRYPPATTRAPLHDKPRISGSTDALKGNWKSAVPLKRAVFSRFGDVNCETSQLPTSPTNRPRSTKDGQLGASVYIPTSTPLPRSVANRKADIKPIPQVSAPQVLSHQPHVDPPTLPTQHFLGPRYQLHPSRTMDRRRCRCCHYVGNPAPRSLVRFFSDLMLYCF